MSFKTAEQKKTIERTLYYGVAKVKVLIVNPTHQQLIQIYNNKEVKEPVYKYTNNDGVEGIRLDFFFKSETPDIIDKITFFLNNEPKISKTGSMQIINAQGQSTWTPDINNITQEWFNKNNVRQAKDGEVALYDFLCTLFNIDTRDNKTNVVLETYEQIIKGNVKELNELLQYFNKERGLSEVQVLLGVKDGKYQAVYNGAFLGANSKNTTYLHDKAKSEYGGFSASFKTMPVQEYNEADFQSIYQTEDSKTMQFGDIKNPFENDDSITGTSNPFGDEESDDDIGSLFTK